MNIILEAEDLRALVRGEAVERENVRITLADIGVAMIRTIVDEVDEETLEIPPDDDDDPINPDSDF